MGGVFLAAGGIAYYYLSQMQNDNGNGNGTSTCSDYTNAEQCANHDCYWYNNSCHSDAPVCSDYVNQTACQNAGCYWCDGVCQSEQCGTPTTGCEEIGFNCYPSINGWQVCDPYTNNLCKCDGSNWNLVEENSSICINDISYQKCGVNESQSVMCFPYMGYGSDECDEVTDGCSCATGNCPADQMCARSNKCVRKSNGETYTQSCSGYEIETPHGLEHWCSKDIGVARIAQTMLGGQIYYKWAGWGDIIHYGVDLWYDGQWNRILERSAPTVGDWGVITIEPALFSSAIPFSYISVGVNSGVSNVHIRSWGLTFKY